MSDTEQPRPLGEPEDADEALAEEALDEKALDEKPAATSVTGALPPLPPPPPRPPLAAKVSRPDLSDRRDPLYREIRGLKLRLDPPDLARLRELPGSRGKSDTEIGEAFFDGQAERLAEAVAGDVPEASELRVVVDPYSRQAFVALEGTIRGILSF